jgi:hypothetical protein
LKRHEIVGSHSHFDLALQRVNTVEEDVSQGEPSVRGDLLQE